MKRVYSNSSEVMHLFANKTQSDATNQSRNAFFNDNALYSYGYHYKLAEHLKGGAILINDMGYSVTTSKHIGQIGQASRHKTQFFSSDVLLDEVLPTIENLVDKLPRARTKKADYIQEIKSLFNSFEVFQKYLVENKINKIYWSGNQIIRPIIDKRSKEYKRLCHIVATLDNIDILESEVKEVQRKKAKKEKAKQNKLIKNYRDGKNNFVRLDYDLLSLRYEKNEQGKEYARKDLTSYIHTSQNVKISLEEGHKAIKGLEFWEWNEEKINENLRGQKIGYYTITKAKNKALYIGCHKIKFSEIQRLSKDLKKVIKLLTPIN